MTNAEIAIAIGRKISRIIECSYCKPESGYGNESECPYCSGEGQIECSLGIPDFLNDDRAAFEIDDWLHGQGCGTALEWHPDESQFLYTIFSKDDFDETEVFRAFGPTRSVAIVAAFTQYHEHSRKGEG